MAGGQPRARSNAKVSLLNEPDSIRAVEREILEAASTHGYPEAAQFAIRLALEEAVFNAFRHGHKHLPDEPVLVDWTVSRGSVRIVVEDRGPGFTPDAVPDPTHEDRLELPHGRGVMLMKAYMTQVEYNDRGNRVTMVYQKPQDD
ncbi:MAG TPA: ATP-binding protein [Phycisphaerales bacterium]|nr:ATP-binding protein [Phycisphaerales bacterium]